MKKSDYKKMINNYKACLLDIYDITKQMHKDDPKKAQIIDNIKRCNAYNECVKELAQDYKEFKYLNLGIDEKPSKNEIYND